MQDIRVFSRLHHDATDSVSIRRLTDELYDLTRDSSVDVFGSLASFEAREFMQVLRHLRRGSITVAGDHDQIVWRLCAYLSTLGKGDSYCTVTVPAFWRPENVGVRGRYLSMNLEVVRYGATIRRLFLLTPHDRDIAEVRDVVKAHIELQRQFDAIKTHDWTGSLETRFLLMREDDRRREIASGCHHGLWLRAGSAVSLIPQYDIDGRVISVHVTRLKGERQSLEESFMKRFELGKPLEAWATGPADDAQLSRRPGS